MSKGDAGHAAQHQHGVVGLQQAPAVRTVEQRLAELEERVAKLEAPAEAVPAADGE